MADAKFKNALDAATQYIIAKRVKQGKITKKEQTDFIISYFLKELAA